MSTEEEDGGATPPPWDPKLVATSIQTSWNRVGRHLKVSGTHLQGPIGPLEVAILADFWSFWSDFHPVCGKNSVQKKV